MKFIAYILFFLMLTSSVVPCDLADGCNEDEHSTQTTDSRKSKGCTACPAFSMCSAERNFTPTTVTPAFEPSVELVTPSYAEREFSFDSGFHTKPFQPPRAA